LGHRGPGAVARAEEEDPRPPQPPALAQRRPEPQSRMEGAASRRQEAADTRQIDPVVGVAAIGGAAPRRYQRAIAQLAQMVRDQVLRLADERRQLADDAVAAGELAQQAPTHGMPGQLQKVRRRDLGACWLEAHVAFYIDPN